MQRRFWDTPCGKEFCYTCARAVEGAQDLVLSCGAPLSWIDNVTMSYWGVDAEQRLAARTLEQRISCWRPFRRWLLATHGLVWPLGPEPLLEYFKVRQTEGAARSSYDSLLSALRFLEEAGEVAQEDKLSSHQNLTNSAKEAALQAAQTATTTPRGQAPQLPLALLVALESEVLNRERPLFHRGFAWYRLLRHWAALRWNDSQALAPSSLVLRARGLAGNTPSWL